MPKRVLDNEKALKVGFMHYTMTVEGLVCCTIGDKYNEADKEKTVTDANILNMIPDSVSMSLTYRDDKRNNEQYVLRIHPSMRGERYLVTLEAAEAMESVSRTVDMNVAGNKDEDVVKLVELVRGSVAEVVPLNKQIGARKGSLSSDDGEPPKRVQAPALFKPAGSQ